jgi:ectoine hydroxylase-related dioxygenase (phytanoyl-CoA dioxygenase family)
MRSEEAINFWIPLRDVDVANGALSVYPGSHKLNAIQCEETSASGYQVIRESQIRGFQGTFCEIDAGDVLVFHPYMVHGSNRNRSEHIRWTVTVRYDDATEMPWLITGQNPYRVLDIQQSLTR